MLTAFLVVLGVAVLAIPPVIAFRRPLDSGTRTGIVLSTIGSPLFPPVWFGVLVWACVAKTPQQVRENAQRRLAEEHRRAAIMAQHMRQ